MISTKDITNIETQRDFWRDVALEGVIARNFAYFLALFLPASVLFFIITALGGSYVDKVLGTAYVTIVTEYIYIYILGGTFTIPTLLWLFKERGARKLRRESGLGLYKNVKKEWAELQVKNRVQLEEGFKRDGDLGYWHNLLTQGAITQAEYDKKKSEILK